MKMSFAAGRERGLTRAEVLVIVVTLRVLAVLSISLVSEVGSKSRARRIQCANNLKEVGLRNLIAGTDVVTNQVQMPVFGP